MARVAQSRNLKGLNWLTKKRVTYRRDVGAERRELKRQAMEERKERIALKRLAAQERAAEAQLAAADRKIAAAEKKTEVAEKKTSRGAMSETQFENIKAHMEREIAAQERHKAAVQARNPSWGYGIYQGAGFATRQLAHFKSRAAAETYARSHGLDEYSIKRAFPKHRENPCASTRKSTVSDRAKRYRANQPGCKPKGVKKCRLCGAKSDLMVDHIDGDESNGRKSNLRWLCRSCNTLLGAEMARAGEGRRTVQYNPGTGGAKTLGEYIQAVLQHTRGAHDDGGRIIHETPKSRRRAFASEIWSARHSRGTASPGSASAGHDAPDWVSNPSPDSYTLQLYDGLSKRGNKHHFHAGNLELAQRKAQDYADDMGFDAVLYESDGQMVARFTTSRPHSWRRNATGDKARINPEPDADEYEQARKIAELFHGRPVKEEITVTESIREHDWLWRIGPLVKLKIRTLTKRSATLPFHQTEEGMVHLFCSPDGRQFYLRGGDQELDLKALGMGPGSDWFRDHMLIGEAKEITYRDKKKFHHFKLTEYYHKLGEVTKKKPMLAYDAYAHKMQIVGGQYKVETDDLVDGMSPGIVN